MPANRWDEGTGRRSSGAELALGGTRSGRIGWRDRFTQAACSGRDRRNRTRPRPSRLERYDEELGRAALGLLAPPIIATGRGDVRVAGERRDGRDVGAGVEQVADERPPQIVRAKARD